MIRRLFLCVLILLSARSYLNAQADQLLKFTMEKFNSYDNGLREREYVPDEIKPGLTAEKVKKDVKRYLEKFTLSRDTRDNNEYAYYNDSTRVSGNKIKSPVIVTDDYIEFTASVEGIVRINFCDILFDEIAHSTVNGINTCLLTIGRYHFSICISEFPDLLFFLQYNYGIKFFKSEADAFKPVASKYLSLREKPAISEEQRKYFIQGNAMAQSRQIRKAIKLYNIALAIDPVSYPEAYYNLALIASLTKNYPFAVCCMKKYIMLMPDAEDKRSSQDKIYEWEVHYQ